MTAHTTVQNEFLEGRVIQIDFWFLRHLPLLSRLAFQIPFVRVLPGFCGLLRMPLVVALPA